MIFTLFSLFVAAFFFTETRSQTNPVNNLMCPPDWVLIGDHCYLSSEAESSWEDANVRCHSFGGYILVLESDDEFNAINSILEIKNVWLGCTDRYNESTWLCYGEKFSDTLNWTEGRPNGERREGCLHIQKDPLLRDGSCVQQKGVICEGEPDELHTSQYGSECPHGWMLLGSRCYFQGGSNVRWERANMVCESFGGNLLTIDTEEELMAVIDVFIGLPDSYWIGCRDHNSDRQWLCFWENMTSFTESLWAENEPKKSGCVAVDSRFQMVTRSCSSLRDFLCEVELSELNVGITGNCPPRWVQANETCYFYSYDKMTWNTADEYCRDAVSQLVVSETATERDIVRNLFPGNDVWVGCKKHNGSNHFQCQGNWTAFLDFADDDEVSALDEEHCLVMGNAGQYRKVECSSTERNFVCQMPKDQYLGCYSDTGSRALAGGLIKLREDNNLKNCMAACNAFNYVIVGLQSQKQCHCGNEQYSRYGQRSDWECGSACNGQENQYCGDEDRQVVYKVGSKSTEVTRKYDLRYGKRLTIYVYTSLITPSLITCAEACTSKDWCLSFNFCESGQVVANSTKTCELNTGIKSYAESDEFIGDEFCIFGEVDIEIDE